MNRSLVLIICVIAAVILFPAIVIAQLDTSLFAGMKARSIGPAGMSGRIGDLDVVLSNPSIIYVGAATGGLWKSTNGGTTWRPMMDEQPVAAIGAVTVFQPNPSVVWVGTGEGNPRNSASIGNGVYKSLDAGDTWMHLGLEKTERIHRIVLDPRNESVAYVGAMGSMWGENPDRGVYKTTDGGKSWRKVLYVNEKVGCADLVMDPSNPNKLFAAMWEYRRWPWFFKSGGPGSGLYVSYDAGETWKRITEKEGLPKGELGRIGVAVAANNPSVVYALVEATKNALLRSDDGGTSWQVVNESSNINPRPFYYCDIRVDPTNENRIYSLHTNLTVSHDGGKTFTNLTTGNRVHSDHHALWVDPRDGMMLIDGNDGGIAISQDRGRTWRFVENLPLAQYYHINVDMETPYNVFGGMQDNGSWRGPNSVWENGGIRNWHFNEVAFGDGFATLVDAADPNYGYAMSQGGFLVRFNWKTGERKDIRPAHPDGVELRFNWNAGIAQDPFDPKTIYYGSQFVHKSTSRGDSWMIISPDLTTNDTSKQKQLESGGLTRDVTAAENYTTILTIAPSPLQRGVIWVGTDDGHVQVTQDGGKTWTNVVDRIPDVPKNTWVPHIEASKFDAGTAYVVFDDHRRGNFKTYLFKTTDFGKSWTSLTKNDPTKGSKHQQEQWGYALVIEQDPVKKELLYLGTEFGLWISFDDGRNWMKWTHGFPTVSAMAMLVHPREHDLVIGTHGRAAYILDDIRPLRSVSKEIFEKPLHLFEIPPAQQYHVRQMDGYHFPGDAMFRGENRPYGALITYSVNLSKTLPMEKKEEEEPESEHQRQQGRRGSRDSITVKIEILDGNGQVIRRLDGPAKAGINRAVWNLRRDGFRQPRIGPPPEFDFTPQGPEVLPGTYTVKVRFGKEEVTGTVEVKADPRYTLPITDRQKKLEAIIAVGQKLEVAAEAVDRLQKTKQTIDLVTQQIRSRRDSVAANLRKMGEELKKAITDVSDLFAEEPGRVQGLTRNPNTVAAKLGYVARSLSSSWDAPTETQAVYARQAEEVLKSALDKYNDLYTTKVELYKKAVEEAKLSFFPERQQLDLQWRPRRRE